MWLAHHGVKGQHWGIKNGPPYPIGSESKVANFKRPHSDYNLDKWGKSKDTNILWISGLSGSGKSTMAYKVAKKNNADVINMDLYTYSTIDKNIDAMSKGFNKYLDKHVPDWKQKQAEAYQVLTKNDRRQIKKAGEWFDIFEAALLKYGEEQFCKRKVIAEGVQILDDTIFLIINKL